MLLSVVEGPVSEPLTQFLVQVVVILMLVRLLAKLLHRIRQPMVIGEIIAGVLLGPSAFGQIPGFSDAIFPKSSLPILGRSGRRAPSSPPAAHPSSAPA